MVKKLSCVSCDSLKRFPHIFTTHTHMPAEALSFECRNIPCLSLILQYGSLVFTRISELSVMGRKN